MLVSAGMTIADVISVVAWIWLPGGAETPVISDVLTGSSELITAVV